MSTFKANTSLMFSKAVATKWLEQEHEVSVYLEQGQTVWRAFHHEPPEMKENLIGHFIGKIVPLDTLIHLSSMTHMPSIGDTGFITNGVLVTVIMVRDNSPYRE